MLPMEVASPHEKSRARKKVDEVMDQKTYLNLKKKIVMALRDGMITPEEITNQVLNIKTKKQLTNLMNVLNMMYSNNEIVPVTVEEEKHLMLVRR